MTSQFALAVAIAVALAFWLSSRSAAEASASVVVLAFAVAVAVERCGCPMSRFWDMGFHPRNQSRVIPAEAAPSTLIASSAVEEPALKRSRMEDLLLPLFLLSS
jgi:hypothetical protein